MPNTWLLPGQPGHLSGQRSEPKPAGRNMRFRRECGKEGRQRLTSPLRDLRTEADAVEDTQSA